MEDGYFDDHGRTNTIILCTESFTKMECEVLQELLLGFGIITTLKIRNTKKGTYRIRISKRSSSPRDGKTARQSCRIPLVRELVTPYMHPVFMYKLG